ncbi:MAG: diguanylate cyclase [Sulfurimonadaceae bacterium]|jgi:diguanylate cyclase (GGDEF)-like protein/PAS domain S-box-containing protein|nr:diguanylate cyclase [Sulfurimonadaceae bacterium]
MNKWYKLHIKNEIFLWFILVSIFPLITLFSINYYLQKKQFEMQAVSQLQLILNEKISLLENQINHLESETKLIASIPDIANAFIHSNDSFIKHNQHAISNPKLDKTIEIFLNKNRYYDLFFINNHADIIYSLKKESDLEINLLHGTYTESNLAMVYKKAKILLETNISPFEYYHPSDQHSAFIAHPIYKNGKMQGVIAIQLTQAIIFDIFSDSQGLGISGELFAASKNKQNKVLSMTPLKYEPDSVKNQFQFPSSPDLSANKSVTGSNGSGISKDYRGVDVISTWGYIPALDWGVVAKIDKKEVLEPLNTLEFYSMILLFFVLLIIMGVIMMAIKNIVSPIDKLTQQIKKFAQGDLDVFDHCALDLHLSNEIGILETNFHEMAHSIQTSQETIKQYALELEDKVKQRTNELECAKEELEGKNISMSLSLEIIDKYVIISSTDLDGIIVKVSQAFCELTGYSKEELLGNKHSIVRHPSVPNKFYEEMWDDLTQNKIWSGEIKNRKKDGSTYWVFSTISPTYDRFGEKVGYTSIRQDITNQKIVEELSITDALTGIYNRRHFNTLFAKMIQSSQRNNDLFCFLILDIDHFKFYNDNYGHQMGDIVLRQFASTLQNSLKRVDDYTFRLGGEEFGIIYKAENPQKALHFAEQVINDISSMKLTHEFSPVAPYITASAGLYCKHAKEINSAAEVYKETDVLLYRAKNEGRNRVVSNI